MLMQMFAKGFSLVLHIYIVIIPQSNKGKNLDIFLKATAQI